MSTANFLQRVDNSKCIRCNFETAISQSFAEQDESMRKHLEEAHPNWQTDGIRSLTSAEQEDLATGQMAPHTNIDMKILNDFYNSRMQKLEAFFKEVAKLTLEHDELNGSAVVYPSKLGDALERVDSEWWK